MSRLTWEGMERRKEARRVGKGLRLRLSLSQGGRTKNGPLSDETHRLLPPWSDVLDVLGADSDVAAAAAAAVVRTAAAAAAAAAVHEMKKNLYCHFCSAVLPVSLQLLPLLMRMTRPF